VNRRVALNMLIGIARSSMLKRQFIFFSPHGVDVLGDKIHAPDIKLHKLKAPRNDQGTLEYAAAVADQAEE